MRALVSPHPQQYLLFSDFFMILDLPVGVQWHNIAVWFKFCWWLMKWHMFSHVFWSSVSASSLETYPFKCFAQLKIVVFLWARFEHSFFKLFFLLEVDYNIVLVSATHQHESVTGIHMSHPSWTSLPSPIPSHPSRLSQSTGLSSLCHTANSHWLSILHIVMYMFPCCSQFVPPSPSHTVSTRLFFMSESPLLPCK